MYTQLLSANQKQLRQLCLSMYKTKKNKDQTCSVENKDSGRNVQHLKQLRVKKVS